MDFVAIMLGFHILEKYFDGTCVFFEDLLSHKISLYYSALSVASVVPTLEACTVAMLVPFIIGDLKI